MTKLIEDETAQFEALLTPVTDPDLVVEWYYKGKKLAYVHRFHDFSIVIPHILYCYDQNSGVYEFNKYGEDSPKASLKYAFKFIRNCDG